MDEFYAFRREDNDELFWVDFEAMIHNTMNGFMALSDGTEARRVPRFDRVPRAVKQEAEKISRQPCDLRPIVSDALGFPTAQLADFEADRAAHGFSGVEFKPDPQVPEFTQVHFKGREEWARYVKHRGYVDRNGSKTSAVLLSQDDLDRAKELVSRTASQKKGELF